MSAPIIAAGRDVRVVRVIGDDAERIVVEVSTRSPTAPCPTCGLASLRVHSVYLRTLRDAPWRGCPVVVHAWVRRFFCDVSACPQTIFCARVPWAPPRQRRTAAFSEELCDLGWATNAETAARTARRMGLPTSPDMVLRCLRAVPERNSPPATIIGIDDWAIRRGQNYGTVIVDLESHRVLDVLEGRDAETVAAWLKDHPDVRVVLRDRDGAYARGVREAAPAATQVADRFHLLKNLGDALRDWLKAHPAPKVAQEETSPSGAASGRQPEATPVPLSRGDERRTKRWQAAHALREQGQSISAIARRLGLTRGTVYSYLRRAETPRRQRSPRRHLVPWQAVLEELYAQGERTGVALWAAAKARGYPGAKSTFYVWLREHHPEAIAHGHDRGAPAMAQVPGELSAPEWARACLTAWPSLPRSWTRAISDRLRDDPAFRATWTLIHEFHTLVSHRRANTLSAWQRRA